MQIAYNDFLLIIESNITKNTKIMHTKVKRHRHEWVTEGIITSCKGQNVLYKKFISGLITKEAYSNYKNKLTKIIRNQKKTYYENFINTHKTNSRLIWQHLNKILGRDNRSDINFPSSQLNNLNSFFANLGPNTTKDVKRTDQISTNIFRDF